jgi:hypothetical protein
MNLEAEVQDVKQHVLEILRRMDDLIYERELVSLMKLTGQSLSEFLEAEPDIYTLADLRVRYDWTELISG